VEEILSVGIDIGTTTTQVAFSRLQIKNVASYFSVPKVEITGKEVVYRSGIHFTPLTSDTLIDGDGVRHIVEGEFQKAGFCPGDTSTGAVIITGESARKENARIVTENLSHFAGDFVVSTVGPDLEAVIAGKGSGAWRHSIEQNCIVANLDIGGGTTNIAVFDRGDTATTGCYDIGGRLICVEGGRICWVSPAVAMVAAELGISLRVGKEADAESLSRVTVRMAEVLEEALKFGKKSPLEDKLRTAGSTALRLVRPPDAVCFSGGVADCIFNPPQLPFPYGDIGALLGRSVSQSRLMHQARVLRSAETIRATVIGAGTYTTTVSGSTIAYTEQLLPLKNIPCLKLTDKEEASLLAGEVQFLAEAMYRFLQQNDCGRLMLAIRGPKNPGYAQLKDMGRAIAAAWRWAVPESVPVLVATERDIAKALGQMLRAALDSKRDIVCIDGVNISHGDYIDMGRPLQNGTVIPVVVKTLLFGGE